MAGSQPPLRGQHHETRRDRRPRPHPIGTFGGSLRPLSAADLATAVVRAVVQRSGVDPDQIEDVVFAQSYANSEAPCIGRWAALNAGLPVDVPGLQIDRRCGGGLQAVVAAAMMVQSGAADVVITCGVESMSNMGLGPVPAVRKLFKRTGLTFDDMARVEINEAFAVQVLAARHGTGTRTTSSTCAGRVSRWATPSGPPACAS